MKTDRKAVMLDAHLRYAQCLKLVQHLREFDWMRIEEDGRCFDDEAPRTAATTILRLLRRIEDLELELEHENGSKSSDA